MKNIVPIVVATETTNACMLKCVFCGRRLAHNKVGFMTMKLFKRIVDECYDIGVNRIIFDKDGDPLLDPNIIDRLKYIKGKGDIMVSFNTPACKFNYNTMRNLLRYGLDSICFSVLAHDSITYRKLTGEDYMSQVISNIDNFLGVKSQLKAKTWVTIKALEGLDDGERIEFLNFWNTQMVDNVTIDKRFRWIELYQNPGEQDCSERSPCPDLFTNMNINWDGSVSICCIDSFKDHIVGDANRDTILDIWNGDKIRRIRTCHMEKRFDEIPLCKTCNRWSLSKLKVEK